MKKKSFGYRFGEALEDIGQTFKKKAKKKKASKKKTAKKKSKKNPCLPCMMMNPKRKKTTKRRTR